MAATTDSAMRAAAQIVSGYFSIPTRTLVDWAAPFAAQVEELRRSGPLTQAKLDPLVEPYALQTLALDGVPVYGAGFIAAIDLLSDARTHLSWWQGADRRRLVLASQSVNKEDIDYSTLEWFRVPMATGEPHVAGPYVDYLCSEEYTITVAVPAQIGTESIGVAGLDVLVTAVEKELTPRFMALGHQVTLVNGIGRVVVSTDPRHATGESVRGGPLGALPRLACDGVALDVIVEEI
ncbi:cache domain-containing protein [Microbacterium sp.]|uniref:cache domain-containing protein n=1 Tax=Microbacterium sp. TaxID=51671 RepID=UPI0039E60FF2